MINLEINAEEFTRICGDVLSKFPLVRGDILIL